MPAGPRNESCRTKRPFDYARATRERHRGHGCELDKTLPAEEPSMRHYGDPDERPYHPTPHCPPELVERANRRLAARAEALRGQAMPVTLQLVLEVLNARGYPLGARRIIYL